jgi:hypothetical protein
MLLEDIVCGERDLDFVHLNRFLELMFAEKPICQAHLWHASIIVTWFGFMVLNATFNNISVISGRSVSLVEETGVPEKNSDLSQVTDKLIYINIHWKYKVENISSWHFTSNSNKTSFFRFVNKRAINRLGIISLANAPVHTFKQGKIS